MSLQAWGIVLYLVQVCLQIVILWLVAWLVRLAPTSPSPKLAWTLGPILLVVPSTVPVSFLAIALWQQCHGLSPTLWFGLGCTVSIFETTAALVRLI